MSRKFDRKRGTKVLQDYNNRQNSGLESEAILGWMIMLICEEDDGKRVKRKGKKKKNSHSAMVRKKEQIE